MHYLPDEASEEVVAAVKGDSTQTEEDTFSYQGRAGVDALTLLKEQADVTEENEFVNFS